MTKLDSIIDGSTAELRCCASRVLDGTVPCKLCNTASCDAPRSVCETCERLLKRALRNRRLRKLRSMALRSLRLKLQALRADLQALRAKPLRAGRKEKTKC